MILITEILEDIKSQFPGGNSDTISSSLILKKTIRRFLTNVNPRNLIRKQKIINGLSYNKSLDYWTCPEDIRKPISIEDIQGQQIAQYFPPDIYSQKINQSFYNGNYNFNYNPSGRYSVFQDSYFTTEYINGKQFLRIRYSNNAVKPTLELNNALSLNGVSNDSNQQTSSISNYINLLDQTTILLTSSQINNTSYTNFPIENETIQWILNNIRDDSFIILPCHIEDVSILNNISVKIISKDNNNIVQQTINIGNVSGSSLTNGDNFIQIPFTANQTYNSIYNYYLSISISATTQQTQTNIAKVYFSKMIYSLLSFFYIKYLSENLYSSDTASFLPKYQDGITKYINIDNQLYNIFYLCGCIEYDSIKSANKKSDRLAGFLTDLNIALKDYYLQYPDSEKYPQYDSSPAIVKRKNDLFSNSGDYSILN